MATGQHPGEPVPLPQRQCRQRRGQPFEFSGRSGRPNESRSAAAARWGSSESVGGSRFGLQETDNLVAVEEVTPEADEQLGLQNEGDG